MLADRRRPIVGRASVATTRRGGAFATHIVDVEVDPETGKVDMLRYTGVQDCRHRRPSLLRRGTDAGRRGQGIGWALNEEYVYDNRGRCATPASWTTACRRAWTCR